ncbi:hypothetical protein HPP92_020541 [Vanilla planifolia]|uniref:Uncharacterized protein n=1 Tax=Vanilla planifolia TaxID=51239 RepID=A0A835QAX6_VANPL|nr:hypothetical protein HPP92_020541 [Vanilla planifolia]
MIVKAFQEVPKARWQPQERLWMFPSTSLVAAEQRLRSLGDVVETLAPNYAKVLLFMLLHGARALLADEMGLGKTLQAIAIASSLSDFWPVLVLTPSSLRLHWAAMIQQWLGVPAGDILAFLPHAGSTRGGYKIVLSNMKAAMHLDGCFNIVSYDTVPKLQDMLLSSDFKKAQYAILLSGTPALSRPIELFKQLEALHPDVYKSVHEYGQSLLQRPPCCNEHRSSCCQTGLAIRHFPKRVVGSLLLLASAWAINFRSNFMLKKPPSGWDCTFANSLHQDSNPWMSLDLPCPSANGDMLTCVFALSLGFF